MALQMAMITAGPGASPLMFLSSMAILGLMSLAGVFHRAPKRRRRADEHSTETEAVSE